MTHGAQSIQPNFPEISVQNSMDRFGRTGKVSKKRVHILRWSSFFGRTGLNFGRMDRAHGLGPGKPGPRAAKPITPPYVENNYRIEVKITFMLIAYLVLLCGFF